MKTVERFLSVIVFAAVLVSTVYGAAISQSVPKGWSEDFEAAKTLAEKNGKLILLAFSGSDWCGWCVKMEKEIYSDKTFISGAKKKFLLLMIDSPRDKSILSAIAQKQNRGLVQKYRVRGFPTTLIVDAKGEEVHRFGGYQSGGVEGFLAALDKVAEKAGVKGLAEISEEEARKDDRFFPSDDEKSAIASRESKQRMENAKNDLEIEEFAGIKLFSRKSREKPKLEKPYLKLSRVQKAYYTGNMLTGLVLDVPAKDVKAMTEDELRVETCRLVRVIEGDLGIKMAVTSSKIDFTGKKTQILVRSSKSAGVLSVQVKVKK